MSPPSGTMLVRGLSPGPGQRLKKGGLRFGHLSPPGQLAAERVNKRIEIAGTVRPEQAARPSHLPRPVRHPYDVARREDVTSGSTAMAAPAVRAEPQASAGG